MSPPNIVLIAFQDSTVDTNDNVMLIYCMTIAPKEQVATGPNDSNRMSIPKTRDDCRDLHLAV